MNIKHIGEKAAHTVRVVTIPPVMATLLIVLYAVNRNIFITAGDIVTAVLFLVVVPVISYPFCRIVPRLHAGGRKTQRDMAFVFSAAGYLIAVLTGLALHRPSDQIFIYLTYMLSVLLLAAVNRFLHFKASGHACSMIWPILLCGHFYRLPGLLTGGLLYITVLWSSVKTKRHTAPEFLTGSLICLVSAVLAALIL